MLFFPGFLPIIKSIAELHPRADLNQADQEGRRAIHFAAIGLGAWAFPRESGGSNKIQVQRLQDAKEYDYVELPFNSGKIDREGTLRFLLDHEGVDVNAELEANQELKDKVINLLAVYGSDFGDDVAARMVRLVLDHPRIVLTEADVERAVEDMIKYDRVKCLKEMLSHGTRSDGKRWPFDRLLGDGNTIVGGAITKASVKTLTWLLDQDEYTVDLDNVRGWGAKKALACCLKWSSGEVDKVKAVCVGYAISFQLVFIK